MQIHVVTINGRPDTAFALKQAGEQYLSELIARRENERAEMFTVPFFGWPDGEGRSGIAPKGSG